MNIANDDHPERRRANMIGLKDIGGGFMQHVRKGRPEVVVVTGSSAGIGRAIAREFGRHGSSVGLLARGADGVVEIAYFGLLPEFIGRGAGRSLLAAAINRAWSWRGTTTRVWLHTCSLDHPRALPNYLAAGFRVVREESYVARLDTTAGQP